MNRLNELYDKNNTNDFTNIHSPSSSSNKIEIKDDNDFENYTKIKNKINNISTKIQVLNTKNLSNYNKNQIINNESEAKLENEINEMIINIGNDIKLIKDDIVKINNEIYTESQKENNENNENNEIINIKKNQCKYLSKILSETIINYQKINENLKKNKKEKTIRLIKIIYTCEDGTTLSDNDAENLALQEINMDNSLFQNSKEKLNEILENRNDILKIERSMRELTLMFNDLSALILSQGELLVAIDENIISASDNVKNGRNELKSAKKYAENSSSKMKWICCILLVILILIILAVVLGLTIPK